MGRTVNKKGKEKREKRKEERVKLQLVKTFVDKAKGIEDPLEPFHAFKVFNKHDLEISLFIKPVTKLEENVKDWIFDLIKRNMKDLYEQCSWGWSDKKKSEELFEDEAWYLIAKTENDLIGYSHFRFDLDYGLPVLYWFYELQLESHAQRKGLGKFMMQILELIAFRNNMQKVILTVLKNNESNKFFKAINYGLDETSPTDDIYDDYPYEIFSKINKKFTLSVSN